MSSDELTSQELFQSLLIFNAYEFTIGMFVGFISNELIEKSFKYVPTESIFVSFLVLFVFGSFLLTLLLYIREWIVRNVPGLREYNLEAKKNWEMPPPLALGFGFWGMQQQLKARYSHIDNQFKFGLSS